MTKYFLLFLAISCAQTDSIAKYQRKEWKHWSDENRDCLNTRAEILKKRSLVPVVMNKKKCGVISGKWKDYYYSEIHTEAKKIDIDHIVALKNAHATGASNWSKKRKEEFANDPENLVITNRTYNRQKGAKGIDKWLPTEREYACKYAKDWYKIKVKYALNITSTEQMSLKLLQENNCKIF